MTKLLQVPQRSGLNQNNIMVASATEQQIQSRVADVSGVLLPAPISCTIQLYGVKTDGTVLNQEQVACNSSQRIHVAIDVQTGNPFSTITQALLLIKKVSGSGSFAVFPATASNVVQSGAEATNFVTEVTLGSDTYFAIDITAQVKNNVAKMLYLAICSENGSTCTLYSHLSTDKPSIDVAFVKEDVDFAEIVPGKDSIGSNGGYYVDVRNGKLVYTQQVYQAPGGYLPFALSMSYCSTDHVSAVPNGITRPLTGWIFNYDQSIRVSGNNLIYLDGNHRYHEFVPAGNNSSVWSNSIAKDGTYIIQNTDGTYQLTDGKATTMNFNTDNRLAEIVAPNGQKIQIAYTDGNISQITVGSQATYTLTYAEQTITLKNGDEVLSTITLNSDGGLAAVTNGQSDNGYTFTYDNSLLYKVTDVASKQVVAFTYNTAKGITSVKRSIKNPTEQASSALFFTYDNKHTIVSHCRNTHSLGGAYKKMEYLFAQDGTLLNSFERIGMDEYKGLSFKDKDDYMFHYSRINGTPYWTVDFSGQKSVTLTTTSVDSTQASTEQVVITGNSPTKQCVLTGQALVASSNYVPEGGSGKIALYLMEGTTELCHLEFDPNSRERQVVSKPFELSNTSHTVKVVVKIENMRAAVLMDNIKIIPLLGTAVTEFTTADTGKDSHTDPESVAWYEKGLVHFNHNGTNLATNVKYTQKDHLLTMQSKAKDSTSFNLWYNDGANILYGVDDDIEIQFVGENSGVLRNYNFCSRTFAPGKVVYSYPAIDTNLKVLTVTYTSADKFVAEQHFNTQGQLIKEIDQDGVITTYTYNTDGLLTKTRIEATGDLMNIEHTNTYYDKMLKSSSEIRNYTTYTHSYTYGTNLELASETFPNGLVQNYQYSNSNNMLTDVSATVSSQTYQNSIAYSGDLLTSVTHNGTTFNFAYDTQNNIQSVQVTGETTPIISKEITYNSNGTTQSVTTYGNGQVIKKYYDKYDRLIKIASIVDSIETAIASFIYSDEGVYNVTDPQDSTLVISASSKLRRIVDHTINRTTDYEYDELGNITSYFYNSFNKDIERDSYGRLYMEDVTVNGEYITNYYVYKNTNTTQLARETARFGNSTSTQFDTYYAVDTLNRPTQTKVVLGGNGYKQAFEYTPRQKRERVANGETSVGGLPSFTMVITDLGTTNYISAVKEYSISGTTETLVRTDAIEYDANGNITKYGDVTYEYDKLGRLTKETNPTIDRIKEWCYDTGGNISSRTEYAYTTGTVGTATDTYTYTYGNSWKDQLTSFNGQAIEYDQAGNPTTYKGATLTWERGRNMATYHIEGDDQYFDMCYDSSGKRASKHLAHEDPAENEVTTYYFYDGNNLVCEKKDNGGTISYRRYLYNSQGVIGYVIGSTVYTYRKNLFGDIVAIYQGATKVAEYAYDAWGNCTVKLDTNGIGTANPFRYRGYYWDDDLKLYYLMSRYYDPQTGRFISPAKVSSLNPQVINGLNLYSYANNTPIGIAYSSSSVYGSSAGGKVSSLGGVIPQNSAVINNQFTWPNLDFLGTGFGYIENTFSMVAGVVDGVRKIKHLDKLVGLDKASNRLMGIGILINVGLSFYNNLTNSSLTGAQRAGNIVGDIVYIGVSSFATWGLSALTAMLAGIGPFVAPIVGFGVGVVLDQFWHGEDILGIDGFAFNPGGQSIDEWIKEWLTNLFGG